MARSGRFGRLPRAQPSLTNTLLAIAREQQNQEDSNIMSAWAKGGMFKGEKATDEFVIAYWRKRVAGVSKDDPLYDTYKNAVTQYEYTIAESKRTAAYSQIASPTAGDDRAMGNFYLNWAKKIPKDSEFYRVLLRDAGQYMRRAASVRKAVRRADTEKIYRSQMNAIEDKYERGGQLALDFLTRLAQEGAGGRGVLLGQSVLGDPSNSMNETNISQLDLSDIDGLNALLGAVGGGTDAPGGDDPIFFDASDRPVTRNSLTAALKAADPNYDGTFDLASLKSFVVSQKEGIQKRMVLAKKTGHMSEYQSLGRDLERVDEYDEQVQATPVLAKYAKLKNELRDIERDDSLSPPAQTMAMERVLAKIGVLADDPTISTDGHLQSQFRGEAEGVAGTVTVSDDMQGLQNSGAAGSSPTTGVAFTQTLLATKRANAELANQPGFAMTQGDYQPDGTFVPSAGGNEYGAASIQMINNLPNGGAGKAVTVMISDGAGGLFPVLMVPSPITATATYNGEKVESDTAEPAGAFLKYNSDGRPAILYRIKEEGGMERWTPEANIDLSKGISSRLTESGMTWDFSDAIAGVQRPENLKNDMEIVPGSGLFWRNQNDATGKGGVLQIDGARAAWFTVPDRARSGPDPDTDRFSPTLANALDTPDGFSLVSKYKDDPSFLALVDADNRRAAGQTEQRDPTTGQVVGWAGGDNSLYQQASDNAIFAIKAAVNGGVTANMTGSPDERGQWQKMTTALTPVGAFVAPATEKLPTEIIQRLQASGRGANAQFMALAMGVSQGSNMIDTSSFIGPLAKPKGAVINTGLALKVPAFVPPVIAGTAPMTLNSDPYRAHTTFTPYTQTSTFGPTSSSTTQTSSFVSKMEQQASRSGF